MDEVPGDLPKVSTVEAVGVKWILGLMGPPLLLKEELE